MQNLLEDLKRLLRQDDRLVADRKLLKNKIIELGFRLDPDLIALLLTQTDIRKHFFQEVQGILVFDKIKFQKFVSNKTFLPDSYTTYKINIGLTQEDEYLKERKDVVLSWPYKDCVLEGGQTKEHSKSTEILWNETLAPDEIDRLLTPKALVNFKRYTSGKISPAPAIHVSENLLIKGNNLLSLCTLKKRYANHIKLIYIDPPYNTGKDSFGYNDSFRHSSWLTFMKNRLEVARELLAPDGVIFISIDVNEQAYLKVLCDEIFNRDNFVGEIIWETATDNNATQISVEHEYVICYAREKTRQSKWQIKSEKAQLIQSKYQELKVACDSDIDKIEKELNNWINSTKKTNELDLSGVSHYSYVDEKGVFYPGNSANTKPGGYTFDILHPVTKKVCNKPANGYRWPESTFWQADRRGDVLWGGDESSIPKIKKRLDTATELLKGYFYEDNRRSTKALTKLMGGKVFDNPKSINLLKKIIKFTTRDGDIILDFFAGSGSTGEAVLAVNREEKTTRHFILCEQMDYIETVTAQRIRKCLANDSFVYCELAALNQNLVSSIKQIHTLPELFEVARNIKSKGILNGLIKWDEFEHLLQAATGKDINELKRILYDVLDKNQLYIPLSEISDEDYSIAETDRRNCLSILSH